MAKVGLCTYSARGHDGRRPWKVLLRIALGEEIPPGIALGDPPGTPPGDDIASKVEYILLFLCQNLRSIWDRANSQVQTFQIFADSTSPRLHEHLHAQQPVISATNPQKHNICTGKWYHELCARHLGPSVMPTSSRVTIPNIRVPRADHSRKKWCQTSSFRKINLCLTSSAYKTLLFFPRTY